MPLRLTGINSGLDTESIITALVSTKKTKVDKAKKEQTLIEWKQDTWKELNTKLLNLYQKTLGSMRLSSAYGAKKTTASNSNAVSVVSGANAVNGVQTMTVDRLAKAGYLTGAQLSADGSYSSSTKLSELGITSATSFDITSGGKTTTISVDGDTTIDEVVNQLKAAGVNANFDEKNQRFYISAQKTGVSNDFDLKADASDPNSQALMDALGIGSNVANWTKGQNAKITLNGVEYESDTNTFEINGLTITALEVADKEFTLTTDVDTDGIYNTIKNFIKEYNEIINEMDKLYNAESSKYEPLTDDEKDELSEKEIEKWEEKAKESVLRRDNTVSSISSALKSIMSAGVEVNGKQMYLSDFGIGMLSYFEAADNEKYAYHINGDPDDSSVSGKDDKLRALIASDPETVKNFFQQLSQNMYTKMSELSSRIDGYRSYNSFFYDKKIQSDYDSYTKKIAKLEDELTAYEDKWYNKFSAMETALAKLQSNQSAVAALLGG